MSVIHGNTSRLSSTQEGTAPQIKKKNKKKMWDQSQNFFRIKNVLGYTLAALENN